MHTYILLYLIALTVSFSFTFFSMPFLLKFCKVRNLYDLPGQRKVHKTAIPRLGGALFAPSLLAGALVVWTLWSGGRAMVLPSSSLLMCSGFFLIYLVGVVDDLVGVRARNKFMFQLIAACFMPACGLYFNNLYGFCSIHTLPFWIGGGLTVFATLTIVNAINLIDGIDGLASSICTISLLALGYSFCRALSPVYSLLCIALSGSVVAFMWYNMKGIAAKGTKTFMGDSGSLVLGYALTYLSVKHAMTNPMVMPPIGVEALGLPLSVLALPVLDMCRVAMGRICNGVSMFHADNTHLHHLLMQNGLNMRKALLKEIGVYLLMLTASQIALLTTDSLSASVVTAIVVYTATWMRIKKK